MKRKGQLWISAPESRIYEKQLTIASIYYLGEGIVTISNDYTHNYAIRCFSTGSTAVPDVCGLPQRRQRRPLYRL